MITEVIMKRDLLGMQISQKSKSGFLSATDLERAGNLWRLTNGYALWDKSVYLSSKSAKEFLAELESKYGTVISKATSRHTHTWVHPILFIDMALSISPTLKVEVYDWLFDNLIKFRNDSGDSYKEACAALYTRFTNHKEFPKFITEAATFIKLACDVKDWQTATTEQLKTRDRIHEGIKLYSRVMQNPYEIVRLAILEYTNKNVNIKPIK